MSTPTPVVIVAGWLGAGKTTALTDLVARLPGKSAVVVNDFGEARIDATLLDGVATLTDIPGGCVCCTAPAGLAATLTALLDEVAPARILIEPSGLAHPQDVVDMLERGALAARVARGPTLVLVDPARLLDPPEGLRDQLGAADVLVANRCDLADAAALAAFRAAAAALWPVPARVLETRFGVLPPDVLDWPPGHGPRAREGEPDHDHHHAHEAYAARSRVYPPDRVYAADAVRAALAAPGLERVKGIFRTDLGWLRFDRAGGHVHVAPAAYRRDTRFDAIALRGPTADAAALDALEAALGAARVEAAPLSGEVLVLVDATGGRRTLDRAALASLPGQIADVSTVVPGRSGVAVGLSAVLELASPPPGARFVVVASDGMTTAPTPLSDAAGAVLVHGLDGGPLPTTGHGGPFRLLVAPDAAARGSRCANVKGVALLRVVSDDGEGPVRGG